MQKTRTKAITGTTPRTRNVIWKTFLGRLAANIGPGAAVVNPKPMLVWRDGPALNHLQLRPWTVPDRRSPGRRPGVTRIAVNEMVFDPSKALLRRLGFEPGRWPGRMDHLRLEWTTLDDELEAFADWLPIWVRGRLDPAIEIPLPPHPSHVWSQGNQALRTTSYAWTAAAWDAYSQWEKMDPTLTRGSISAECLTPAVPTVAMNA